MDRNPTIKVLFCARCRDMRALHGLLWVQCMCGNSAARFKTSAHVNVEVIALHKEDVRIFEPNRLFVKHWATLLKVGEVDDISFAPALQKSIDDGQKLPIDFVKPNARPAYEDRRHPQLVPLHARVR